MNKNVSRTRRDVLWGYLAQGLNVGAGLILLPLVARYLTPPEVGLWFVFITLAGLAQLLEFGFQPTLVRNVAYVYAGASSLEKNGLPPVLARPGSLNVALLSALVDASRVVYRWVAVAAAVAFLLPGTWYVYSLLPRDESPITYLFAWILFATGYVLNFYFGHLNGLLQGRGDVTVANKISVVSRAFFIVLSGIILMSGGGLIGLGLSATTAAFLSRWMAWKNTYTPKYPEMQALKKSDVNRRHLISILWHNASRMGVVQLGAFLIQRASILVASSFLGLAVAASYSMTITVLLTLTSVGMVVMQVYSPRISSLQVAAEKGPEVARLYGEVLIVSWTVYAVGALILCLLGPALLDMLNAKTRLLPLPVLAFACVVFALELNHSIAAMYLTTTNRVPFVLASVLSGVGILVFSLAAVGYWGAAGLIAVQGGIQLSYNNWKWPREALAHLRSTLWEVLKAGTYQIRADAIRLGTKLR